MSNATIYEDKADPKSAGLTATQTSMSATCALKEVLQLEKLQAFATTNYAKLASHLLLRVGSCNGLANNDASDQAIAALTQLVERIEDEHVLAQVNKDGTFSKLGSRDYPLAINTFVSALVKVHPELKEPMCEILLPYIKANYVGQKYVVATIYAQFVEFAQGNLKLLDFFNQ